MDTAICCSCIICNSRCKIISKDKRVEKQKYLRVFLLEMNIIYTMEYINKDDVQFVKIWCVKYTPDDVPLWRDTDFIILSQKKKRTSS